MLMMAVTEQAFAQANGIYADFVTSLGTFTCGLDYTNAPKAVANFIGLATGHQAWLDLNSGRARTNAFYDGTAFHRVIAGFMIQGGSPNGLGTDGPGYVFEDEFTAKQRFDAFGVLAMANSGPDSNGAQFFVTVAATAWLNDVHTILGRLVSGSNVVAAISRTETDAKDKPLTNIVLERVSIRREGSAAQAFDLQAQSLPRVVNLPLEIANHASSVTLVYSNRLYADNKLFTSTNLTSWPMEDLGIDINDPIPSAATCAKDMPYCFYALAQVQYPASTLAPKSIAGRTLTLNISGSGALIIAFDSSGGGSYTFSQSSGTIQSYDWAQKPYNGLLWPIQYSGLVPMTLKLNFDNAQAGTFTGTAYPSSSNPFTLSGSFSLSGT